MKLLIKVIIFEKLWGFFNTLLAGLHLNSGTPAVVFCLSPDSVPKWSLPARPRWAQWAPSPPGPRDSPIRSDICARTREGSDVSRLRFPLGAPRCGARQRPGHDTQHCVHRAARPEQGPDSPGRGVTAGGASRPRPEPETRPARRPTPPNCCHLKPQAENQRVRILCCCAKCIISY